MNRVVREDLAYITAADFIPWNNLEDRTLFVTGVTGLIGSYLTSALLARKIGMKIIALVRNAEVAEEKFSDFREGFGTNMCFLKGSMEKLPEISGEVDYIIHCASPTSSEDFAMRPVETISSMVRGCGNVLKLAKEKAVKGLVYLSSMEVYGAALCQEKISETHALSLDAMNPRNSYPFGKLLCENLCAGYASEYGVPAKVVRLTQTFGPGVRQGDKRFFAYLLEQCRKKEDIVLLTEGKTQRCYLYLADAVTAILTVLLVGEAGHAYNAANEASYCSIRSLAELAARTLGEGKVKAIVRLSAAGSQKYMGEHCMDLDTSKMRGLGWQPKFGLTEMLSRSMEDFVQEGW